MTTNPNLMLNGLDLFDALTDRETEDRDYSPVPAEYRDMSWMEIVETINEYEREVEYARRAREEIPYRWQ